MPTSSPASRRPSSTALADDSLMHLAALGIGGFTSADLTSSGAYVSKHDLTSSQHALIQGSVRGMIRRAWREFDAERLPIDTAIKAVVAGGFALTVYAIMYRVAMAGQVVSVVVSVVFGVVVVGGLWVQEGHTARGADRNNVSSDDQLAESVPTHTSEHEKALELEESVHGTRLGHGGGGRGLSLNALNDMQSARDVAAMTGMAGGGGRGSEMNSHASFHHPQPQLRSSGTGSTCDHPMATAPTSLNPSPRASVQHPLLGPHNSGSRTGVRAENHLGLPPLLGPSSGSSLVPSLLSVGSSVDYSHSHSSGLTASSVGLSIPTSINSAVSPRSSASIVPSLPDVTPSSAPGTEPRNKQTTNRRGLGVLSPMVPTVMSTISSVSIHLPDPMAAIPTHSPATGLDSQPLATASHPAPSAPVLRAAASSLVAEPGDVAIPSTSSIAIMIGSTTASALMVASTPPESTSSGNVFARVSGEQDAGVSASAVQTCEPAPSQVSMAATSTASTSEASVSATVGGSSSGGNSKVASTKASGAVAVGDSTRLDEFHSVASVGQASDVVGSEKYIVSAQGSEVESRASLDPIGNMVPASSMRASTSTTFSLAGGAPGPTSSTPPSSTAPAGAPSSFRPTGLIAISPALALRLPTFLSPIASSGVSAEAMTISDHELGPAMRHAGNMMLPASRRISDLREDEQEGEASFKPPEPAMMIPVGQHLSMSRRPNPASQRAGAGASKGERRASFSALGVGEELEMGETPSLDRSGAAAAAAAAAVAAVSVAKTRAETQPGSLSSAVPERNVPPGIFAARQRQKQALGLVEAPPTTGLALGPGLRPASESESVVQMKRFASEVAARLQRVAAQAGSAVDEGVKGKIKVEQEESESVAASPSNASVGGSLDRLAATAVVVGGKVEVHEMVVGMADRQQGQADTDAGGLKPARVDEQSMLLQVLGNQQRQQSSVSIVVHDDEGDINVVRDGATAGDDKKSWTEDIGHLVRQSTGEEGKQQLDQVGGGGQAKS